MDFDLRQLEVFCKVAELGSISRAAEAVHLAPASVSERVATLERMVGTRLLDRLGRKVELNRAGRLLYARALKLLEMKKTTCEELEGFLGIIRGQIEVGGSTIPGEHILPGLIQRFRESYPEVMVRLSIGGSGEISQKVSEGAFDLGVVGFRSKIKGLVHKELWKDTLALVVSSSHRWAKKKSITLDELHGEPFILREGGSGTRRMLEKHLGESPEGGREVLTVVSQLGSSAAIKEGIKRGLGVSIISSRAVEEEVRAGTLKTVRVRGLFLSRSFYLVRDRRRSLSPLSRSFADFLLSDASSV